MSEKYQVCVIESESGWGQKREYSFFDTYEKAKEYRDYINSFNEPLKKGEVTPSWYMVAEKEIRIAEN